MNTNKELVHKSQSILKDFGYEVKTTHLHEMYARLAGYKNIHEATAKKDLKPLFIENIEKIINKLDPECLDTLTIEAHAWLMVADTLNVITRIEAQQYRDEIRARTRIRVLVTGGKYRGEKGTINPLDHSKFINQRSKVRVYLEADEIITSCENLKQISEKEYRQSSPATV